MTAMSLVRKPAGVAASRSAILGKSVLSYFQDLRIEGRGRFYIATIARLPLSGLNGTILRALLRNRLGWSVRGIFAPICANVVVSWASMQVRGVLPSIVMIT
jgi:hypothetical protein